MGEVSDPSVLSCHSHQEKRKEKAVKRNEGSPEMNLVQCFVHHPSKHLWKPEGNRSKHPDNGDREKGIMKVCNHEITIMKINIQSTSAQIDSCDSAYQK